jgi:hypothetical protein
MAFKYSRGFIAKKADGEQVNEILIVGQIVENYITIFIVNLMIQANNLALC